MPFLSKEQSLSLNFPKIIQRQTDNLKLYNSFANDKTITFDYLNLIILMYVYYVYGMFNINNYWWFLTMIISKLSSMINDYFKQIGVLLLYVAPDPII